MKKLNIIIISVVFCIFILLLVYLLFFKGGDGEKMVIVYRGEEYKVNKNDPDYNRKQIKKIEQIIVNDEAPVSFKTFSDMVDYHNTLEAPGYGSSTGGFGEKTKLGQFTFLSVEIPKRNKHRVLVYRRVDADKPYELFDDFMVTGPFPPVLTFNIKGRTVEYVEDITKNKMRKKEIPKE